MRNRIFLFDEEFGGGVQDVTQNNVSVVDSNGDAHITVPVVDSSLDSASENAVQNKAVAELIPAQASSSNQLADKNFVNSTVQTNAANFRGNFATWSDVPTDPEDYLDDYRGTGQGHTPTPLDYMVVVDASDYEDDPSVEDPQSLDGTWRFKYQSTWAQKGKYGWFPEYSINGTAFTAAQLDAINSGITAPKVALIPNYEAMSKADPVGTGSLSMNRKANTTVGAQSVALGYNTTASATRSVAVGSTTTASQSDAFAEGTSTTASGMASHAEGSLSKAQGSYSHAEGSSTTASSTGSHSEGSSTTASGNSSHAEGSSSRATGTAAHAEGSNTLASQVGSHAEGIGTTSACQGQHVCGQHNVPDTPGTNYKGSYVEIVGNGTSGIAQSNARTLDWDGNGWFAGDVFTGSGSSLDGCYEYSKFLVSSDSWEDRISITGAAEVTSSNTCYTYLTNAGYSLGQAYVITYTSSGWEHSGTSITLSSLGVTASSGTPSVGDEIVLTILGTSNMPFVQRIGSSKYSDNSRPMWQMTGVSQFPTQAEESNFSLVKEAWFDRYGLVLYASAKPTVNMYVEVKGV